MNIVASLPVVIDGKQVRRERILAGVCEPTLCRQGWAWQLELIERKWSIGAIRKKGFGGGAPSKFVEKSRLLHWL